MHRILAAAEDSAACFAADVDSEGREAGDAEWEDKNPCAVEEDVRAPSPSHSKASSSRLDGASKRRGRRSSVSVTSVTAGEDVDTLHRGVPWRRRSSATSG